MIFKHSPAGGKQTWRTIEEATIPGKNDPAWYRAKMKDLGTKVYVTMTCGHECRIVDHSIDAAGGLQPSLQCSVGERTPTPCSFHVSGCVLEGYTGPVWPRGPAHWPA